MEVRQISKRLYVNLGGSYPQFKKLANSLNKAGIETRFTDRESSNTGLAPGGPESDHNKTTYDFRKGCLSVGGLANPNGNDPGNYIIGDSRYVSISGKPNEKFGAIKLPELSADLLEYTPENRDQFVQALSKYLRDIGGFTVGDPCKLEREAVSGDFNKVYFVKA